jgi:RNA polymerase sigma-70 factor (ECF subfamily)
MTRAVLKIDDTVLRAKNGDHAAWGALIARHGPRVYGLCRRLTPAPEDAYQEIWEKVFKALARFDIEGSASFQTWLMTIAQRHLIDRHRRRRARGEVVPLHEVPPVDPTVERHIADQQQAHRLELALSNLPERQRIVVVLHHLEGVPLAEIAAQLAVSIGTVKSRLHRGRARLAHLLRSRS